MFPVSLVSRTVRSRIIGASLAAALASAAYGQSFSDIQFWVGNGSNQAAFVVDWKDGNSPQSLVWGYRWDGVATGEDMLHAIVSADARLFAHVSTAFGGGLGTALFGMGYDANNNGVFGVSPALSFDAVGYSVGGPGDGRTATDAGDHWQEGWFSDGYWSYWLGGSGASPTWDYSGLGMSSRVLTDGAWDGWSYAPGFMGDAPSMPIAATIPAPGGALLMGAGCLFVGRRRRGKRVRCAVPMTVVAALAGASAAASAQYQYDPNDFAVEVTSSVGFPMTPGLYTDPAALLGGPATMFRNTFPVSDRRVKIIEPAYNVSPPSMGSQRLITTFNAGQSVTVRMGRTVYNDPSNPFGIDLNVFGNAFFSITGGGGPGGFVDDATNLNNVTVGGVFNEPVRVSVSPDNVNWYTYSGITGDGLFPTNAYRWDAAAAAWTNDLLDPTKPIDPALYSTSLTGMTAAQVLALYDGSAGGTGFDLAVSGFSFINYVRFDGITGFSGGEIDAVAAVRAIPAPGALALLGVSGALVVRRRR